MGSQGSHYIAFSTGAAGPMVMEMLPFQNKNFISWKMYVLYDQSSDSFWIQAFYVKKDHWM